MYMSHTHTLLARLHRYTICDALTPQGYKWAFWHILPTIQVHYRNAHVIYSKNQVHIIGGGVRVHCFLFLMKGAPPKIHVR